MHLLLPARRRRFSLSRERERAEGYTFYDIVDPEKH